MTSFTRISEALVLGWRAPYPLLNGTGQEPGPLTAAELITVPSRAVSLDRAMTAAWGAVSIFISVSG